MRSRDVGESVEQREEIQKLEKRWRKGGRDEEEKEKGPEPEQQQDLPLGRLLVLAPDRENKHEDSEASIEMVRFQSVLDSFFYLIWR